jgi:hypothetical protein
MSDDAMTDDGCFYWPEQRIVSTVARLAAMTASLSWWPVGGEMFFLTAPFIELAHTTDADCRQNLILADLGSGM